MKNQLVFSVTILTVLFFSLTFTGICQSKLESCFNYFNYGSKCDIPSFGCDLYYAILDSNYVGVDCLVKRDFNLDVNDSQLSAFEVPIIHASLRGDAKMVAIILSSSKIEVDRKEKNGLTALILVSSFMELKKVPKFKYYEVTKVLLQNGADVNIQNNKGETPLLINSEIGRLNYVNLLIKYKANPNIQNALGKTALMLSQDDPKIIKILLSAKANVLLKDKKGRTAIFYAIERCQSAKFRLLQEKNRELLKIVDSEGLSPLDFAKQNNLFEKCPEITKQLR